MLRAFSRRRVEIENELARRGESRAAQLATLATRKAKDYGVPAESLAAEWHRRADALGFDADARLFGRTRPVPLGGVQLRHNRRQACAWERAALDELRTGDPLIALEAYRAAGRLRASASGRQAREDLVAAWWGW